MTVEISRQDVTSEFLMEYPADSKFLKLPIDPYMDLLGVEPLPSQQAIINAVNNPKYRFVCAAISRRQGKTYIANIIGQLVSLVPNSNILIMSPNYSLSQISFDLQRNLIKHFDLEVTRDNAKDKVIELKITQKLSLSQLLVERATGLQNSLIADLPKTFLNGALFEQLIKIIRVCLKAILQKLGNL